MPKISSTAQRDSSCTVTVLSAAGQLNLCKEFVRTGKKLKKIQYSNAKNFRREIHSVNNIHDLAILLKKLEKQSQSCIVRGNPKKSAQQRIQRTIKNFSDPAKRWVLIDFDNTVCPDDIDPISDPEAAIAHLINLLPSEFHGVTCYWQWSSSFGISSTKILKAHVWFFLDRPVSNDNLKYWAKWVNENSGYKLIDPALFNIVQIHYTAAPIFRGMPDPLVSRSGLYKGHRKTAAVVLPPPSYQPALYAVRKKSTTQKREKKQDYPAEVDGFEGYLELIGEPYGFNQPIFWAILEYFRECEREENEPDFPYLKRALKAAILFSDPGDRSNDEIKRYASNAYLNDDIRRIHKKFLEQQEGELLKTETPFYEDRSIPLPAVRTLLDQKIADFFEDVSNTRTPPRIMTLAPDVGSGKTEKTIKNIARVVKNGGKKRGKIVYFTPTHSLAIEIHERLIKEGIRAFVFRGRSADNPNGEGGMCADPRRVELVQSFGGEIDRYACGSGKKQGKKCPLYNVCAYQQQKNQFKEADVIIMTHPMLFLPPPAKFKINCAIIDESFFAVAITEKNKEAALSLPSMQDCVTYADPEDRLAFHAIVKRLETALIVHTDGRLTKKALRGAGIKRSIATEALRILNFSECKPHVTPDMDTYKLGEALRVFKKMKFYKNTVKFWTIIENFLSSQEEVCPKLKIIDSNQFKILSRRQIHPAYNVPTLILDATARQEIISTFFSHAADIIQIEVVKPYQYVRQITNVTLSYASFRQSEKNSEKTNDKGRRLVKKIREFIEMEGFHYKSLMPVIDVLVICPKPMQEIFDALPPLPPNVAVTHYGAFRGKDSWRNVRKVIIISRPLAASTDVAEMAEALTGTIVTGKDYFFSEKAMRTRQGKRYPLIKNQTNFPHDLGEAIRWTITEGELIQAIGRGRGVNRTIADPLHVDVLTNVVLPLTVDQVLQLNDILPSRYDKMSDEGLVLLSAADQTLMYPDLFPSAQAAKLYAKRWKRKTGGHSSIESFLIAKCNQFHAEGKTPALTHKMSYRTNKTGPLKTFLYNENRIKHPAALLSLFLDVRSVSKPEPLAHSA